MSTGHRQQDGSAHLDFLAKENARAILRRSSVAMPAQVPMDLEARWEQSS